MVCYTRAQSQIRECRGPSLPDPKRLPENRRAPQVATRSRQVMMRTRSVALGVRPRSARVKLGSVSGVAGKAVRSSYFAPAGTTAREVRAACTAESGTLDGRSRTHATSPPTPLICSLHAPPPSFVVAVAASPAAAKALGRLEAFRVLLSLGPTCFCLGTAAAAWAGCHLVSRASSFCSTEGGSVVNGSAVGGCAAAGVGDARVGDRSGVGDA